jgi:anti-sigma regulatory factor (Ser/Thr protein kinase)
VSDALVLRVPNEDRFLGLIRLFISGLASKFDLPYERLDDLQLAVETVLTRDSHQGAEVTLRIEPLEQSIAIWLHPVDERTPDEEVSSQVGLNRLLATLVDLVSVVSLDDERWLRLEQRIPVQAAT